MLSVAVFLLPASLGVPILRRRPKAPTQVGCIITGIPLGHTGLSLVGKSAALGLLIEIGVSFPMFYVGLKLSSSVLVDTRRAASALAGRKSPSASRSVWQPHWPQA